MKRSEARGCRAAGDGSDRICRVAAAAASPSRRRQRERRLASVVPAACASPWWRLADEPGWPWAAWRLQLVARMTCLWFGLSPSACVDARLVVPLESGVPLPADSF